jgi:hypothetical protein
VFVGSLCLIGCSRVVGSLFLSFMGAAFFYFRFIRYDDIGMVYPYQRLLMLFLGGLLAVSIFVIWHFSRRTHDQLG